MSDARMPSLRDKIREQAAELEKAEKEAEKAKVEKKIIKKKTK